LIKINTEKVSLSKKLFTRGISLYEALETIIKEVETFVARGVSFFLKLATDFVISDGQ